MSTETNTSIPASVPSRGHSGSAQPQVIAKSSSSAPITPDQQARASHDTAERAARVANEIATRAEAGQEKSLAVLQDVASDIKEAIKLLNESLAKAPTKAVIYKDEELNRFIVKIADKKSGEIVKEIPPEALLKFARNLQELKGILFDEDA